MISLSKTVRMDDFHFKLGLKGERVTWRRWKRKAKRNDKRREKGHEERKNQVVGRKEEARRPLNGGQIEVRVKETDLSCLHLLASCKSSCKALGQPVLEACTFGVPWDRATSHSSSLSNLHILYPRHLSRSLHPRSPPLICVTLGCCQCPPPPRSLAREERGAVTLRTQEHSAKSSLCLPSHRKMDRWTLIVDIELATRVKVTREAMRPAELRVNLTWSKDKWVMLATLRTKWIEEKSAQWWAMMMRMKMRQCARRWQWGWRWACGWRCGCGCGCGRWSNWYQLF